MQRRPCFWTWASCCTTSLPCCSAPADPTLCGAAELHQADLQDPVRAGDEAGEAQRKNVVRGELLHHLRRRGARRAGQ